MSPVMQEAIGWLCDIGFDPDDIAELSRNDICPLVHRHYSGGWSAFVATCKAGGLS